MMLVIGCGGDCSGGSYFCVLLEAPVDAANKVWRTFDSRISAWIKLASSRDPRFSVRVPFPQSHLCMGGWAASYN